MFILSKGGRTSLITNKFAGRSYFWRDDEYGIQKAQQVKASTRHETDSPLTVDRCSYGSLIASDALPYLEPTASYRVPGCQSPGQLQPIGTSHIILHAKIPKSGRQVYFTGLRAKTQRKTGLFRTAWRPARKLVGAEL